MYYLHLVFLSIRKLLFNSSKSALVGTDQQTSNAVKSCVVPRYAVLSRGREGGSSLGTIFIMRLVVFACVIQLVLVLLSSAQVVDLNDKNFEAETEGEGGYFKTDDVWIVSFHAVKHVPLSALAYLSFSLSPSILSCTNQQPWCGHCKKLVPVLDELAAKVHDTVHIGKVDATYSRSAFSVPIFGI